MVYDSVKKICDEKGMTISSVEKAAGIGNGTIAGWKSSSPRMDILIKVANVLEVSIEDLTREWSKSCH